MPEPIDYLHGADGARRRTCGERNEERGAVNRRDAVGAIAGMAGLAAIGPRPEDRGPKTTNRQAGRIKQSVSRWCYGKLSLEELCAASKKIGLSAIDLLDEK